jgi:hypothetical protein
VEWGSEDAEELEELEMVPDAPARPQAAPAPRARSGGMMKAVAVAVVLVLVASSLGAFLLLQPKSENEKPKPPKPPTDVLSDADVFISEIKPSDPLYIQATYVELRVGPGVSDLRDWRLTTFDNDSYVFQTTPASGDPAYVVVNFSPGKKLGSELSLDPADELALYAPDGKLADFVRWAGGGADRDPPRGGWAAADTGLYLDPGQTVSRLDFARCNSTPWNASPPSPGQPNILEVTLTGARQVLWLRSGRSFNSVLGTGDGRLSLPPGRPVARSLLQEAAAHLEFSLKQIRRLGDPFSGQNSTTGAPVLEFWVTNRSDYAGITEPGGRGSLDLGPNRHINSFVCARQMAILVELAKWGIGTDQSLFLREGLAISEGLRSASQEISAGQPSIESLWLEMKNAGLFNPYEHGRNLTVPFITPWDYDSHHTVNAWLFYDFNDKKFVESGLGPSLAQALLFAQKDPLVALQEQTGRNLSSLYINWLDWRTTPGFRYAPLAIQTTSEVARDGLDGMATLQGWTAWIGRFTINFSGSAEFNLSVDPSSAGPLYLKLVSSRTGAAMFNGSLRPGQARSILADDLRPLDELVMVAGASELYGGMSYRAAPLPSGPGNLTPADGSYSLDAMPRLGWSAVAGADRYQVQVAWDAAFLAPELDATVPALFHLPVSNLSDGTHFWRVRGWTPLGNPTAWSSSAQLTIDTVAPFAYPEIDEPKYRAQPTDPWNITQLTLLSFRLNLSSGSPEKVFYRSSDADDWTEYSGTFQLTGADRTISLQYYSQDIAGNAQPVEALPLFLDNSPPSLGLTLGSPNYAFQAGDIVNVSLSTLVTVSATDDGAGIAETTYRIGGQNVTPYAAPFRLSGNDGPVLITIISTDRLGSKNSTLLRLNLDVSPPDFSVQSLSSGILSKGVHRTTVTGSDISGIARVSYIVDGQTVAVSSEAPYEWAWDTAGVPDGDHPVQVRVEDNVGNEDSAFFNVKTDNSAPVTTVDIGTPRYRLSANDLWNVSSKTKFNLTGTDPFSGLTTSWYTVDGAYVEAASFVLDKSLPDGRHNITFGSRDRSGNNETAQALTVVLDKSPPVLVMTEPSQSNQLSGLVNIVAAESSGAKDVAGCTFSYSVDGVTWIDIWTDQNSTSNWNCQWNTLTVNNGNYWLRALMYDRLDNSAQAMVQISVIN